MAASSSSRGRRRPAARRHGARRPALRALADRLGIVPEYVDQTGTERRQASDETRVLLLAAMGVDARDEASAHAALAALDTQARARPLAPARVVPHADALPPLAPLVDESLGRTVEWTLEVTPESGRRARSAGRGRVRPDGTIRVPLPALPEGYHELRLVLRGRGAERSATQRLVVVPPSCPRPAERLRGERVFGIIANLYTVRSARNWGAGDLSDLGALLEFGGGVGAAFVGVNPLHALRNAGGDISPYSPVSRLFRNVLYLDVEAVPELAAASEARERIADGAFRRRLDALRRGERVDYEGVMALKRPVLETLFAAFRRARDPQRTAAFDAYVASQGGALADFATYCALDESQRAAGARSWHEWPAPLRDPRSEAVAAFRREQAERVAFHEWLQFEVDRQLGAAAGRARAAGLPIGLYQDLAIGTSPDGSDAWAFQRLFAHGVSIGAPPDPYSATGQDWGLPPLDPRRLAEDRYDYWITLVRSALRHAGALRMDHVMGLFQQFWIPEGKTGVDGAYVRFPSEDLLGILALEAGRAGAVVVGEDLGTVPPDVPPALQRWGILSSKVLYFERTPEGGFRAPQAYPRLALATANTHDMATVAGFWRGRDIEVRADVGLVSGARARRAAEREREADRAALLARLREEGLLPDEEVPDAVALTAAVHALLRRTPSWLVGLSLDDLVGETEPVNVPGVGPDRFPSWTRRLTVPIEALREDAAVHRRLGIERAWSGVDHA